MSTQLHCPAGQRRRQVRDARLEGIEVNGIDHLEVLATQRTLLVHCFGPVGQLDAGNVLIQGGTRIRPVKAAWAFAAGDLRLEGLLRADELAIVQGIPEPERARTLVVRTDRAGDFSGYTLRLVEALSLPDRPPEDFDPIVSEVAFSFRVDCASGFDCAEHDRCEQPPFPVPQIDYLARDYASFRRLMLDRLAVVMADWHERNPADALVTLVELLAHAGDLLSYYQDAVATEAYLGTARRRASVRRHARLVDYRLHDGANARAWVCFTAGAKADKLRLEAETPVLTGEIGAPATMDLGQVDAAVSRGAIVFETMHALELLAARDEIAFHTWGDDRCCLPSGATRATLRGTAAELQLAKGDVLVFEEVLGPQTRRPEDADPSHRHAVRLSAPPVQVQDPLGPKVLEIAWAAEDALPFPLCLWEHRHESGDPALTLRTSVARGNVALADHGRRRRLPERGELVRQREPLGKPVEGRRFRPRLERSGLTHAAPYQHRKARLLPAAQATRTTTGDDVLPDIHVLGEGERWEPVRELLSSNRFSAAFVVEMEEDGRATLRFGDNVLGRRPAPDVEFAAVYRVGNGQRGNVGARALTRAVTAVPIEAVTNPLPATGGTDPEPVEQVRLYAPQAFRSQRRAVTADDYVALAERHPEVQKAGATRRWTGSWYTMFVTVDRVGGRAIDQAFEDDLRRHLDPFRLAGYDLEIDGPRPVPLEVELRVCVAPGYVRSNVKEALLEALGSRRLAGGRRGFFHPDNLTFGQTVFLSPLIAAAMAVPGVGWAQATKFHRFREEERESLEQGRIELGRLEIARLDNDPNRPENGRLELEMKGGV